MGVARPGRARTRRRCDPPRRGSCRRRPGGRLAARGGCNSRGDAAQRPERGVDRPPALARRLRRRAGDRSDQRVGHDRGARGRWRDHGHVRGRGGAHPGEPGLDDHAGPASASRRIRDRRGARRSVEGGRPLRPDHLGERRAHVRRVASLGALLPRLLLDRYGDRVLLDPVRDGCRARDDSAGAVRRARQRRSRRFSVEARWTGSARASAVRCV